MNVGTPFATDRITRRLVRALLIVALALAVGALFAMATALFDRVHNTLVLIIFAVLLAYAIYPPIKWLGRHGVPVPLAGVIVYAVLAVLLLGSLAWLSPAIAAQATDLTHNYPRLVEQTQHQIADPSHSPLLSRLPPQARAVIARNAGRTGTLLGEVASGFGSHALAILSGTTAVLINFALVLGLTLLILGDLASIQAFAIRLVPRGHRLATIGFMRDVDAVIGGFVRGQVLMALGVAVAGTLVLFLTGVPYAILFGLLAGLVSIVPLIGPFVAIIPAVLIAAFTVGLVKTLIVLALFGVIIGVQQNVLVPILVARSVGVTPLVVFVALLLGSEAYGIIGALLSIPLAGIVRASAERLFPHEADADALFLAQRERDGEPEAQTRKAASAPS